VGLSGRVGSNALPSEGPLGQGSVHQQSHMPAVYNRTAQHLATFWHLAWFYSLLRPSQAQGMQQEGG
jgi:hypothetical protein